MLSGNPWLPHFVEVSLIEQAEASGKSTRWGQVNSLPQGDGNAVRRMKGNAQGPPSGLLLQRNVAAGQVIVDAELDGVDREVAVEYPKVAKGAANAVLA